MSTFGDWNEVQLAFTEVYLARASDRLLLQECVMGDVENPLVQLLLGGQLSEDDEVGPLEKGALLCQLRNGIASIFENTALSVSEVSQIRCDIYRCRQGD